MSKCIVRGINQVLGGRVSRRHGLTRREPVIFYRNATNLAQMALARATAAEAERAALFALVAVGSLKLDAADCEHANWVLGGALGRRVMLAEPGALTSDALLLITVLPGGTASMASGVAAAVLATELGDRVRQHVEALKAALDQAVEWWRDAETVKAALQEGLDEFEEAQEAVGESGLKGSMKRFFMSFFSRPERPGVTGRSPMRASAARSKRPTNTRNAEDE